MPPNGQPMAAIRMYVQKFAPICISMEHFPLFNCFVASD